MTALTHSLTRMGAVLRVVGAAISSAAALRLTLGPDYSNHGAARFPETDDSVRI